MSETADESTTEVETSAAETNAPETEVPETEASEQHEDGADPAARARREAKNLRDRLRAAEAERDALTEQLDTMRTAEVHRLAGEHLARGADLTEVGAVSVADLLDETGVVDPVKVQTAAEALTTERGYLRRKRFQGGADGGAITEPVTEEPGPTWADALRSARPRT